MELFKVNNTNVFSGYYHTRIVEKQQPTFLNDCILKTAQIIPVPILLLKQHHNDENRDKVFVMGETESSAIVEDEESNVLEKVPVSQ